MISTEQYFTKSFIFCLVVGTLLHFTYDISGQTKWIGYFSAVNESIWEHTKLSTFPLLLSSIVIFIVNNGKVNNFFVALPISLLVSTLSIPTLFYGYVNLIGKSIFLLDIAIFCVSCFIGCKTFLYIISLSNFSNLLISIIGLSLTIIIIECFIKWTYNPPNYSLFTKIGY